MLEWTAALCSILGVWLMARRRLSAWPVGLLSVALYGLVFAEAKLYSDTLLQVAFGGFLVYGWLNWRQHAADEGSIRIVPLARGTLLRDLAIGLCGGVALGAAMHTFTDAALPWLDAMLTALSLVGQWWQARRHVACWWVWIAVDVVYVGAYLFKSLHVTAALYVFFLGLAVFGLRAWSAAAREPQVATRVEPRHAWLYQPVGARLPTKVGIYPPSTHGVDLLRLQHQAQPQRLAHVGRRCRLQRRGLQRRAQVGVDLGIAQAVEFQFRNAAIRRDPHAHRQRRRRVRVCLQPFQHAAPAGPAPAAGAAAAGPHGGGVGHPVRRGFLRGHRGTAQCQRAELRPDAATSGACRSCSRHGHRLPPAPIQHAMAAAP
jgi:nicotinamide mononucleotide transporter